MIFPTVLDMDNDFCKKLAKYIYHGRFEKKKQLIAFS